MKNKDKLFVVKIGGEIIDNADNLHICLKQFSNINEKKILIHGGGKIATNLAKKLGIEQSMIDGRRITDLATLEIVTMVYAGLINKKIVALLQAQNVDSIGLCGADGNLIQSKKRQNNQIDYGYVGDIEAVQINLINDLLIKNFTPIISPITHDKKGQLLNTNADSLTNAVAISLKDLYEVQIIYCFDKLGVLTDVNDETTLLKMLDFIEFERLKLNKNIHSGMIPKLDNAFNAKKNGINNIYIGKGVELQNIILQNKATKIV